MKVFIRILSFVFLSSNLYAAPFVAKKLAISAASHESVEAAKTIYKKGGNVVDAAVALSLAMSVTNPYFASLGGGGFALVKMNKKIDALDFREVAPSGMNADSYLDTNRKSSIQGGLAVGVPGIPAGLWALHQKYGKLSWAELFTPAIKLAEGGFRIHGDYAARVKANLKSFNNKGTDLLAPEAKPISVGTNFKQPELARALKFFRRKGAKEFYEGSIAKDIVATVKEAGGLMSLEDMKNYEVRWRKPMTADYKGYKIHMMPPPSSGAIVIKTALHLMQQWKLENYNPYGVQELHLFGEILARSYRSRLLLGDPDFFENPTDKLLSEKYLKRLTRSISAFKSKKLEPLDEAAYLPKESTETTHFSIVDKEGNAVSMTVTLNGSFGSGLFSHRFGINLNSEMDDFTTRPGKPNMYGLIQGSMNKVEPGKRPLSSMTPSIVEKDSKTRLVLGSPGGPRIISSILQVIYRHLVSGFDIDEAIQAPKFHHQFIPNVYYYEKNKSFPDTIRELRKKGHKMEGSWAGRVYGVSLKDDVLEAAFDSRLPGAASGF